MDESKLRDAIFHVLYNSFGFLGGKGTGFIITHNNEFYFLTADHCIDNNINDLSIVNFLYQKPRKIPFSVCLKQNTGKGNDNYLDLCFFKIDINQILQEIKEHENLNPNELVNNLLKNKKIQKILKKNWNIKTKWRHIQNSMPYKRQNAKIYSTIKSLPLSDVQTKNLKYIKQTSFNKGDALYIIGYPAECQEIDNEGKHIKSTLVGIECQYLEKLPESGLHHLAVIEDKITDYDGFSGSPVFYNGDVCGVVLRAGNGNVYFRDLANIDAFWND